MCFAFTGRKGEGSHNGNANSIISPYELKGGVYDKVELDQVRPYHDHNGETHDFGYPQYMTFNCRQWDYNPEFFGKFESKKDNSLLYTPPPICNGCVDAFYPKIGLEGGLKGYSDGSNSFYDTLKDFNQFGDRTCSFYGKELFEQGYIGVINGPHPHDKVCSWDPREKLKEDIKKGPGWVRRIKWTLDGYGEHWCEPEDLDMYETVSEYYDWNICGQKCKVRMTPIRFSYNDRKTGKTKHYDFVWLPTAFSIPVNGVLTLAIRKRWYDMLLYNIKYAVGIWQYPLETEMLVKCDPTKAFNLSSPMDILSKPWTRRQWHNGAPDEPNYKLATHPCVGKVNQDGHDTFMNPHTPVGTSWGILGDGSWAFLDMACARWLWEGAGWMEPYSPLVHSYCRSYYGTRYWENFISTCNNYLYNDYTMTNEHIFGQ